MKIISLWEYRISLSRKKFALVVTLLFSLCLFNLILAKTTLAADIVVDNSDLTKAPELSQTDETIQQINITNPQNGLSHNRFTQYNVTEKGVVINNSRYSGEVAGLGYINANPNLYETAKTILFEVTGENRSELKGVSAIVGEQAKFILANPNGIICNGCGFVNTHEVELRTDRLNAINNGQPSWDKNLNSYIHIGKKGIVVRDGSLLLSSGRIKIRGLTLVKDLLKAESYYTQSTETDQSSTQPQQKNSQVKHKKQQPLYAIDVSSVSSVSAGQIYLIATGEGAGVRVTTPKYLVDKNTNLQVDGVSATKENFTIKAQGPVTITGSIYSQGKIAIQGKDLHLTDATLKAIQDINLSGQNSLTTFLSEVKSGGALTIQANEFKNDSSKYEVTGNVKVIAKTIANRLSLRTTDDDIGLIARGTIDFHAQVFSNKLFHIHSPHVISINAYTTSIQGSDIVAGEKVTIGSSLLDCAGYSAISDNGTPYSFGKILSQDVDIKTNKLTTSKNFYLKGDKRVQIVADTIKLKESALVSEEKVAIDTNTLHLTGKLRLDSTENVNGLGKITSKDIEINVATKLLNNRGIIHASNNINLISRWLSNIGERTKLETFTAPGRRYRSMQGINKQENFKSFWLGTISAGAELNLTSANLLENQGLIEGKQLTIAGKYLKNSGIINGAQEFSYYLPADSLTNLPDYITIANSGTLSSGGQVTINMARNNPYGFLLNTGKTMVQNSGYIVGAKTSITSGTLHNTGKIYSSTTLELTGINFTTEHAEALDATLIEASQSLNLAYTNIKNCGTISSNNIIINSRNKFLNDGGKIAAKQNLELNGEHVELLNHAGTISAGKLLKIRGNSFSNERKLYSIENGIREPEIKSNYLDLKLKGVLQNEGLIQYTDIWEQGSFSLGGFINRGSYIVKNEFAPHKFSSSVLLSGKLQAAIINIATAKNIFVGINGELTSPYAIGLFGNRVDLLGNIKSSLVEIKGEERIINKGKISAEQKMLLAGDIVTNLGKIALGENSGTNNRAAFNAIIETKFSNQGEIIVNGGLTQQGEALLVIAGEKADIDSSGKLLTNKLFIQGKNVKLGGSQIIFNGNDSEFKASSKEDLIIGSRSQNFNATENVLAINAHHYVFNSNRFLLQDNTILKDLGAPTAEKGLFITAKNITCSPNSVLAITSKIIFNTEFNKDEKNATQNLGQVITGQILGYPLVQIQTSGSHQITNQCEASRLIYPKKLHSLYFTGDLAKVTSKEHSKKFNSSEDTKIKQPDISSPIAPLKIAAHLVKIDGAGSLALDHPLLLLTDKLEMAKGSKITSNGWIKVESAEMSGSGFFASSANIELKAQTGWLGGIDKTGTLEPYTIRAKNSITLSTPGLAVLGALKTEEGDIVIQAQGRLLTDNIESGKNIIEILSNAAPETNKLDFNEINSRINNNDAPAEILLKAKNSIKVQAKDKTIDFTGKIEAGDNIDLLCKTINFGAGTKLTSGKILSIETAESISGTGNLESGVIAILSGGDIAINTLQAHGDLSLKAQEILSLDKIHAGGKSHIKFYGKRIGIDSITGGQELDTVSASDITVGTLHSQGNMLLQAKDTLSINEVSANKIGNIQLYGSHINVNKISDVQDLLLYGQKIQPFNLNKVKNVKVIAGNRASPNKLIVLQTVNGVTEPNVEPTLDFIVKTPQEIEGNFIFAGRSFTNLNTFKAGNVTLDLSGNLLNQGQITTTGSWLSSSAGITNLKQMDIGGSLQMHGDYFVNANGGVIRAQAIGVYLTGQREDGKSVSQEADSILETREGQDGGIELIAPSDMYFGYKKEFTGVKNPSHNNCKAGEEGFKYIASQLLSRGGSIHIKAGGDVTFDGAQGFANGDFVVQAQGNIQKNKIVGTYLDHTDWGVVGGHKACAHDFGVRRCSWEVDYGCIEHPTGVSLDIDIAASNGNVALLAEKDIVLSGNVLASKKIVIKTAEDIKLEALKVYNNRGIDGQGDNIHMALPEHGIASSELPPSDSGALSTIESQTVVGGGGYGFAVPKLIATEGIDLQAGGTIELQAPLFFSNTDIKISAGKNIVGLAMLGQYLDKVNKYEKLHAITGSAGIVATLNKLLLQAPEGKISLKGFIISAQNVEAIAKDIELAGLHETAIQHRVNEANGILSNSISENWESHSAAILTAIAAEHIKLTADNIQLQGAQLSGSPVMNAPGGNIEIRDYKIPHFSITEVDTSGLSLPGIWSIVTADTHSSLKDVVISHTPFLDALDKFRKTKSCTDLAPTIGLGIEILRIATASSGKEVLLDQFGLTIIKGIPLPNSIGFYKRKEREEHRWENSIPSKLNIPEAGKGSIQTTEMTMQGSNINIGENGELVINIDNLAVKPSVLSQELQYDMDEDRVGFSYSPTGFGIQQGKTTGTIQGSGYTIVPSYIGGDKDKKTTVIINTKGDAQFLTTQIEADSLNIGVGGNLLLETVQDVWKEHAKYISWNKGVTIEANAISPISNYHRSLRHGNREWTDTPTIFKGNNIYADIGGQCILKGAGILGQNTILNAKSLAWEDIYNKEEHEEKFYSFDNGVLASLTGIGGEVKPSWSLGNVATKSGEIAAKAGSIITGYLSLGKSNKNKEEVIKSTITTQDDQIKLQEQKDVKTLNRDANNMVEVTKNEESTFSIAVPTIDFKELSARWNNKETLLQQMIGDKNLPEREKKILEAKKEVVDFVKEEAIKEGLGPEEVQDVIEELTEEKIVTENIEKLNEYHEGKEFSIDELEEVLSGKTPTKDAAGQISFVELVPKKNTRDIPSSSATQIVTASQDITINTNDLNAKKEALKAKWRELAAEAGELGISFVPVVGPPLGATFSQVVKGERDDKKSLEGLAWGAADFTIAGLLKKGKSGGKLISMVPKGAKLLADTKNILKVKVERKLTVNQMEQQVIKGQAPKTITRVDIPKDIYTIEKIHVHFKDGAALNKDGTWKHGFKKLTNREKKWLKKASWRIPNE